MKQVNGNLPRLLRLFAGTCSLGDVDGQKGVILLPLQPYNEIIDSLPMQAAWEHAMAIHAGTTASPIDVQALI